MRRLLPLKLGRTWLNRRIALRFLFLIRKSLFLFSNRLSQLFLLFFQIHFAKIRKEIATQTKNRKNKTFLQLQITSYMDFHFFCWRVNMLWWRRGTGAKCRIGSCGLQMPNAECWMPEFGWHFGSVCHSEGAERPWESVNPSVSCADSSPARGAFSE